MYIIKNRITNEYDRKGHKSFHPVSRDAWEKLAHAKNHVAMKCTWYGDFMNNIQWYINADFLEIDETGIVSIVPVAEYLEEYLPVCCKRNLIPQSIYHDIANAM